jgi:hypothetical protein
MLQKRPELRQCGRNVSHAIIQLDNSAPRVEVEAEIGPKAHHIAVPHTSPQC